MTVAMKAVFRCSIREIFHNRFFFFKISNWVSQVLWEVYAPLVSAVFVALKNFKAPLSFHDMGCWVLHTSSPIFLHCKNQNCTLRNYKSLLFNGKRVVTILKDRCWIYLQHYIKVMSRPLGKHASMIREEDAIWSGVYRERLVGRL